MEKIAYGGWPNCIRLGNGSIELIATTDVGPRIIRFGFVGGPNLLKESPGQMGKTGGDEWRGYGGHRLWHAPEARPRTYAPDNSPVHHEWNGHVLKLVQPVEASTGIQKEIEILMDEENGVSVRHRLINRNLWPIEAAAWALTVMRGPGRAVLPQEPPSKQLLPVRAMGIWGYTDMRDARWTWGTKYIQLRCDPAARTAQKIGIMNTLGWAAYGCEGAVMVKRFGFDPNAVYPDFGCNTETYTNGDMLEVESVGPLTRLEPDGTVEHLERWFLYQGELPEEESALEEALVTFLKR